MVHLVLSLVILRLSILRLILGRHNYWGILQDGAGLHNNGAKHQVIAASPFCYDRVQGKRGRALHGLFAARIGATTCGARVFLTWGGLRLFLALHGLVLLLLLLRLVAGRLSLLAWAVTWLVGRFLGKLSCHGLIIGRVVALLRARVVTALYFEHLLRHLWVRACLLLASCGTTFVGVRLLIDRRIDFRSLVRLIAGLLSINALEERLLVRLGVAASSTATTTTRTEPTGILPDIDGAGPATIIATQQGLAASVREQLRVIYGLFVWCNLGDHVLHDLDPISVRDRSVRQVGCPFTAE